MERQFPLPLLVYTDIDSYNYTNKTFHYLLGFQPSLGYILFLAKEMYIILDARYYSRLTDTIKENIKTRLSYKGEVHFKLLLGDIKESISFLLPDKKLFVEKSMSLSFFDELKNSGFSISFVDDVFQKRRIIKTQEEKEKIKKAIAIIEAVWEDIVSLNKKGLLIGKTELGLRGYIIKKIFELGGEGESFDSIVAFGKNSATPHHSTGNTVIGDGPLLIDMGAYFEGYASDFTRTLWVGEKTDLYEEFLFIQNLVKTSYEEAKKAVKIGEKASLIDKKARDFLVEAGYGKYFTHSTGHGVGLDIHENPRIGEKSTDILKKGMVFTIEPGLYFPGKFGVRYENIIII